MSKPSATYLSPEGEKDLRKFQNRGKVLARNLANEIALITIKIEEYRHANKRDQLIVESWAFVSEVDRNFLYFEMEKKKKPIHKVLVWCHDLDDWATLNLANQKSIRGLKIPKKTSESTNSSFTHECQSVLDLRLKVIAELLGSSASVISPDASNRESAGGWRHLRDLEIFDDGVLDSFISKMGKRSTPTSRENAIGAAKELLEALARGILEGEFSDLELSRMDMSELFKKVRVGISLDVNLPPALGGKGQGLDQVVGSLTSIVAGITNLRNSVGSGHGRPRHIQGLTETHVVFIVDATYALTRFIAALFRLED